MQDAYKNILKKTQGFVRKYYINQLIKGVLLQLSIFTVLFLLFSFTEYFGHFSGNSRMIMFFLFIGLNAFILLRMLLIPLLKLINISSGLSNEEASKMIGDFFPDIKDKLLNTIQLKQLEDRHSLELIEAGIAQKAEEMRPFVFTRAINLKRNLRFLWIALFLGFVFLFLYSFQPQFVKFPAKRIITYYTEYEKPLPFSIEILNEELSCFRNEDFLLKVKLVGKELPDRLNLSYGSKEYQMVSRDNGIFEYLFRNPGSGIDFTFNTPKNIFGPYYLRILPRADLNSFSVFIDYPAYTGIEDEYIENRGSLSIPFGSIIKWKFFTSEASFMLFNFNGDIDTLSSSDNNVFEITKRAIRPAFYAVRTANEYIVNNDSLSYNIQLIPDLYPAIFAEEFADSILIQRRFFTGYIEDDYGFSDLRFILKSDKQGSGFITDTSFILISKAASRQEFYYQYDFSLLEPLPGEDYVYYFEVWDNDGIHGPKMTRSSEMRFHYPSEEELASQRKDNQGKLKETLKDLMSQTSEIQEDIKKVYQDLINKKELNWEDKERIENILKKHDDINKKMESVRKEQKLSNERDENFDYLDEEIIQKQRELQKLFDELLSDELKDMYKEYQDWLDDLDKEKMKDMLDDMKMSSEDLNEELDRSLELFKRLELESRIQETTDKLEDLIEKEEELKEKTNKGEDDFEGLKKEQEDIADEFKDIRKDINEIDSLNSELDTPSDRQDTKDAEEEAEQSMEMSEEQLKQKKAEEAGKSQQKAIESMQKISQSMNSMMSSMGMQQEAEDARLVREILENLIQLSFDQEELIHGLSYIRRIDPRYLDIIKAQNVIRDNMELVADSLRALASRQMMIGSYVGRELSNIGKNIDEALEELEERRVGNAKSRQQFAMTAINKLALLLAENLEQMQQQMSMSGSGSGSRSCPQPGQGPSIGNLKELQEQLGKQLQEMKDGKNKSGKKGKKDGSTGMSEELVRMAARQSAIREQLQEYLDGLKQNGIGEEDANIQKILRDMEMTETDIVNRMISNQTLLRQKEILSRLLRSERAEKERDKDKKRESEDVKNRKYSNPKEFLEYKQHRNEAMELLKEMPPSLRPYYKRKVNSYLFRFIEENDDL